MNEENSKWEIYVSFLRNNGKSLTELNIPSCNFALSSDKALKAIKLLEEIGITEPILGIDLMSDKNGFIEYSHPHWSSAGKESLDENHRAASNYIEGAEKFPLKEKCENFYYVLFLHDKHRYQYRALKKLGILEEIGLADPFDPFD